MKKMWIGLFIFAVIVIGLKAQSVGLTITTQAGALVLKAVPGTTVANCPAVIASLTQKCLVATDEFISRAGAAWVSSSSPVTAQAIINGKSCGTCTISIPNSPVTVQ